MGGRRGASRSTARRRRSPQRSARVSAFGCDNWPGGRTGHGATCRWRWFRTKFEWRLRSAWRASSGWQARRELDAGGRVPRVLVQDAVRGRCAGGWVERVGGAGWRVRPVRDEHVRTRRRADRGARRRDRPSAPTLTWLPGRSTRPPARRSWGRRCGARLTTMAATNAESRRISFGWQGSTEVRPFRRMHCHVEGCQGAG